MIIKLHFFCILLPDKSLNDDVKSLENILGFNVLYFKINDVDIEQNSKL